MSRDYRILLQDILEAIRKIETYVANFDFTGFQENELVQDAVIRNLEVIGEAVKNIPQKIRGEISTIEWRKIAGLRDILIHAYFGIDLEIVWDVIQNKIPILKKETKKLLLE